MGRNFIKEDCPLGFTITCSEEHWNNYIQAKHSSEVTRDELREAIKDPDEIYEDRDDKNRIVLIREPFDSTPDEPLYTHVAAQVPTEDYAVGEVVTSWIGFNKSKKLGGLKWKKEK